MAFITKSAPAPSEEVALCRSHNLAFWLKLIKPRAWPLPNYANPLGEVTWSKMVWAKPIRFSHNIILEHGNNQAVIIGVKAWRIPIDRDSEIESRPWGGHEKLNI